MMNMMDIAERVMNYNKTFPDWPRLIADKGFILGTWMIGNNYKNKVEFYGGYPPSFLKRVMSLFPDIPAKNVLHLFSGSLSEQGIEGTTFDIDPKLKPDMCGDAEKLSEFFPPNSQKLIASDPPYSSEDAEHYGHPLVNRNKVVKECISVLEPGAFLVWLDQVYPMYRNTELKLIGTIGLIRSTNHRVRMTFIWQKL
jgi:hypothetical protein